MSIIRKEQLSNPLSASYASTASYVENANVTINTGSLLTTASANINTVTFTKGNGSTFSITVDTGSAIATNTGSLLTTASATLNNIQFTKGDGSTFNITVDTGSGGTANTSGLVTTSSFNAFTSSINAFTSSYNTGSFSGSFTGSLNGTAATSSYYQETDPVFVAKSASLATTGSNQFNGNQTITGSLIQGLGNTAGENSHAEGDSTQAIGLFSHAEGLGTIAYGGRSHAEGQDTIASGSYSHAEGYQTIALANHQHVQGQWNATSSIPAAFIVGNGTDNNNRSNLIYAAGNEVQISGSLIATSFTGSLQGTAATASHYQETDPVFTAVSSSFVTTSSFNAFTSSIYSFTSSINNFTSSYNTGSFTGSFTGSLNGTAATASYYRETDPIFTAKSASLATTGSNNFKGNQNITGSINITGSLIVNDGTYDIISSTNKKLSSSDGSHSVDWENRILYASNGTTPSLNWSSSLITTSPTFFTYTISTNSQEKFSSTSNYAGTVIRGTIDNSVIPYDIVYLDTDGTWYQNDQATTASSKKLGIYLDNDLILIEGHIVIDDSGPLGPDVQAPQLGVPIFIRNGGGIYMSTYLPTSGYVRILGHIYYQNQNDTNLYIMRFNPSNDFYLLG